MSSPTAKPLRADAQRNRDRLLEVAARRFTAEADVPLEAVAKEAGVGIGTLYRHFPTRDALVEEAYRHEVARVADAAAELAAGLPPTAALRAWMGEYLAFIPTKRGMADALATIVADGGDPYGDSKARLMASMADLHRAGVEAGELRDDIEPHDVLMSLVGISLSPTAPEQRERMLDLLVDGLRAQPA